MILAATTSKIQAVLSGAITTTNPTYITDAVDTTATPTFTPTPGKGSLNGTTPVDIVAAPSSSHFVKVNGISIYNADTASVQVTVRYNDNGTLYTIVQIALAVGASLHFTDTGGWYTLDANGFLGSISSGGTGRINRAPQFLTTGSSYTTAAGTTSANIELQGGGGGGGGVTSVSVSAAAAGGGAAGQFGAKYFAVSPSTAYAYSLGVAGTAGTNAGGTGGSGGNTSFGPVGGTTATVGPGSGGVGMLAGTTANVAAGGNQTGSATNCDFSQNGQNGEHGLITSGTVGVSGFGGSSFFGGGAGNATAAINSGQTAFGNGAGGGGALCLNGGGAKAGGAGTKGCILVQEYT